MDRWKIERRIKEKGFTMEQFAAKIGMNRATLWRKLTGGGVFDLTEVNAICRELDIEDPREYFFTH